MACGQFRFLSPCTGMWTAFSHAKALLQARPRQHNPQHFPNTRTGSGPFCTSDPHGCAQQSRQHVLLPGWQAADRGAVDSRGELQGLGAGLCAAETLAAVDAERAARLIADAEDTAQSIPDAVAKAPALAAVAEALAAIDPDHAERVANLISDALARGHLRWLPSRGRWRPAIPAAS